MTNSFCFYPSKSINGAYCLLLNDGMIPAFMVAVGKLNKKLAKMATQGIKEITILDTVDIPFERITCFGKKETVTRKELHFYLPVVNPKPFTELKAILTNKDDAMMIMALDPFFNATGLEIKCDHCGEKRYRNKAFVFQNTVSGEVTTVGSTCVDDYYGLTVLKAMDAFSNWINKTVLPSVTMNEGNDPGDSYRCRRGGFECGYSIDSIVRAAVLAYCVDSNWKRMKYQFNALLGNNCGTSNKYWEDMATLHADRIKVQGPEVYEYFRSDEFKAALDKTCNWGQNIYNSLFRQDGSPREYSTHTGLIGFCVFHKLNKPATAATSTPNTTSEYIGTPGQKVTLSLTVEYTRYINTAFGSSTLVSAKTQNGDTVTFFLNAGKDKGIKTGQNLSVCANIKEHKMFRDQKQTMLNYVKL